jgi:hypothetical protein
MTFCNRAEQPLTGVRVARWDQRSRERQADIVKETLRIAPDFC